MDDELWPMSFFLPNNNVLVYLSPARPYTIMYFHITQICKESIMVDFFVVLVCQISSQLDLQCRGLAFFTYSPYMNSMTITSSVSIHCPDTKSQMRTLPKYSTKI